MWSTFQHPKLQTIFTFTSSIAQITCSSYHLSIDMILLEMTLGEELNLYLLPEKFHILWKFVTSCYCGMTCIKSDLLWYLFKRWDEGQSRSRWIVSLCCHACCSRCFHSVQGLPSALRLYFFYWYSNFEKNSPKPYFPDLDIREGY